MKKELLMVTGAGFGLAIGSTIGSLTGSPILWISLGICFGALAGLLYDLRDSKRSRAN